MALGPLASHPAGSGPVTLNLLEPLIRVGLSSDPRHVTISSSGPFRLVDQKTGRDLWRQKYKGPIHVVLQFKSKGPASRYRVQVASLSDEAKARALRDRIEKETGEVSVVTYDEDRRVYRVRVGAASTREGVRPVEEKLRAMGFSEIWVVEEPAGGGKGMRLRLVDQDYESLVIESRRFLALPNGDSPVEVEGKPYRGVVEILVSGGGRLQAVNILNLEDYLKGVVPVELSPSLYPEIEALKAQAVAARTYAYANEGQFSSEGFDLCDTPKCQVYGGIDAEDPVSDEAVEETRGLIVTSGGEPIDALYTATCGGHTEDVKNVFRQEDVPYLKGVPCYAEAGVLAAWTRTLVGADPGPSLSDPSGAPLGDGPALLSLLGVIDPSPLTPDDAATVATHIEIEESVKRALQLAGKESPNVTLPAATYPSVAGLAQYLVKALGWDKRIALLLDEKDIPVLLDGDLFPRSVTDGRAESAYLIKEGILPPRLGPGDDFLAPATRALLYRVLYRLLVRFEALGLESGIYRGSHGDSMIVVPSDREQDGLAASVEVEPAPQVILSREDDDGPVLVKQVTLMPGDRIDYRLDGGVATYIRRQANLRGASDDRFTSVYQWEVRYSRQELEDKISQRASVGTLKDVIPLERGVSGRVSKLSVVGSKGKFLFSGFGIRTLLGLRENLFVVDRLRGADGRVDSFIFTGKGWGHGVGLCQVGAYGMALRGLHYDEILEHYYTGVAIEPIAAVEARAAKSSP